MLIIWKCIGFTYVDYLEVSWVALMLLLKVSWVALCCCLEVSWDALMLLFKIILGYSYDAIQNYFGVNL